MFNKANSPSGTIHDNHFILSLPDALTPVVWVIDLNKDNGFVIRIEETDDHLFVLQKISASGKSEDIAYYNKKSNALQAMCVMKTIGKSPNHQHTSTSSLFSKILKVFFGIVLFVILLVASYILYQPFLNVMSGIFGGSQQQQQQTVSQSSQTPAAEQEDPNAMGVPLSADNFLQQNR